MLVEQVELVLLYPEGADEGAKDVGESDGIKAEISSWLLSRSTRDDEPTCTVFAYDEMYLGTVRGGLIDHTNLKTHQFCFSALQFEMSLLVRPTVKIALSPGAIVIRSKPRRTFGALFGPPRLM